MNKSALNIPCALVKLSANNKDIDEEGSQEKSGRSKVAWDAIGARTSADTLSQFLSAHLPGRIQQLRFMIYSRAMNLEIIPLSSAHPKVRSQGVMER